MEENASATVCLSNIDQNISAYIYIYRSYILESKNSHGLSERLASLDTMWNPMNDSSFTGPPPSLGDTIESSVMYAEGFKGEGASIGAP